MLEKNSNGKSALGGYVDNKIKKSTSGNENPKRIIPVLL